VDYRELLEFKILGNTLLNLAAGVIVTLAVYFLLLSVKRLLAKYLKLASQKTETDLDDLAAELVGRTWKLNMFAIALMAGSLFLSLPGKVEFLLGGLASVALFTQLGLWGNGVIAYIINRKGAAADKDEGISMSAYSAISWIARAVLWAFVALLALNNLGIEVTALVAGLGISGIAVALAVQNILGDLFASLSIVLDKPFVVGDFVIVGDLMGVVQHVGIKTTRLKSISGEQIVFSNTDLLGSRIRNYRRMQERRVIFGLGVTYQTTSEQIESVPGMIREIIEGQDRVRFDRAHFKSFGASSLDFEVVYYVLDRDYALYMDIQQKINLEILKQFEEAGIEFAYPTQTLFVER